MDFHHHQSDTGRMDATHLSPMHHHSSTLEKALEYKLLGEILPVLLRCGVTDVEVFRPDVDRSGWDVGLEVNEITRHIQLKGRVRGGKRDRLTLNVKLARKPSGCVIWFDYDPVTFELGPFLWFGAGPGERLPALGDKVARHTKGNKDGRKTDRLGHRVVNESRFEKLTSLEAVVDRLFGPQASGSRVRPSGRGDVPDASARERAHRDLLVRHLRARADEEVALCADTPEWIADVREGRFDCLPERLSPEEMNHFAHLVNGYQLAQEAGLGELQDACVTLTEQAAQTGAWKGTALELWLVLFGEHRRARQGGFGDADEHLLDGAYLALRRYLSLDVDPGRSTLISGEVSKPAG